MGKIRIATRASKLALAQAHEVQNRLLGFYPQAEISLVPVQTSGDKILDRNLEDIGGKGLFTKEVEEALIEGRADIAVHSMKDMPAFSPEPLVVDCTPLREDPRDAFISRHYASFEDLPLGATLGTSSSRRKAQALARRPDLNIIPFRGNVLTRLEKLERGEADATLLAIAGLNRIALSDHATALLEPEAMLPAVGQGALAIQRRKNDSGIARLLAPLNHAETAICVAAERAVLIELGGSCRTPLAAHAVLNGESLTLYALLASREGNEMYRAERQGSINDAEAMGKDAGEELRQKGGHVLG